MNDMRKVSIPWTHTFLELAFTVSQRSKDGSTQCGAVLVDDRNVIISTGFNGPPPQIEDDKVPWDKRPQKYAYIIHSEENALLFGMEARGSIAGSKIYCTHMPCAECMLRIIRARVKEVIIPTCHSAYPLSKYQVDPSEVVALQCYPKVTVTMFDFIKEWKE